MDTDIFDQFIDQLKRYGRERLIPAEADLIATDPTPEDISSSMREMGLSASPFPKNMAAPV